MKKKQALIDCYGNIIVFKYLNMNYISIQDAEKMRKLHWEQCLLQGEYYPISVFLQICGRPEFVNVEKSFETGFYSFYSEDEIEWKPIPIDEYNP